MKLETFGYIPPLTRQEQAAQISSLLARGLIPSIEHTDRPAPRDHYWHLWKLPLFEATSAGDVVAEIDRCAEANPGDYVKIVAYDRATQGQTAFVVRSPWAAAQGAT
jgi:ribulose-bisphosphate carboxylase small chain